MRLIITAGALVALPASAFAQVHASDVILKLDNGRIVTGRVESGEPVFPRFAFSAELGKIGVPGGGTEPGFDSEKGAFPPQSLVGISIRRALRAWDGEDFDTIPEERMRLTKGINAVETPATDPGLCALGGDLPLGLANSLGVLHQHPGYQLLAPAVDGVYLLELEAWMTTPGGSASAPFWIVFSNNGSPSIVDAAVEYVEGVLNCRADFNRDGLLSVADFGAFQTGFVVGDPRADFNGDCALTVADFGAFQTAYVLGCP